MSIWWIPLIVVGIILLILYFLPTLNAIYKLLNIEIILIIFVLNLLFGWHILPWIILFAASELLVGYKPKLILKLKTFTKILLQKLKKKQ